MSAEKLSVNTIIEEDLNLVGNSDDRKGHLISTANAPKVAIYKTAFLWYSS